MEIVFQVTKEECQKNIDSREGNLCSQCGEKVVPLQTVNNSGEPTFWSGCEDCSKFDSGVTSEVYEISKWLVKERYHIAYSHVKKEDYEASYWEKTQIGGTAYLVKDIISKQNQLKSPSLVSA